MKVWIAEECRTKPGRWKIAFGDRFYWSEQRARDAYWNALGNYHDKSKPASEFFRIRPYKLTK